MHSFTWYSFKVMTSLSPITRFLLIERLAHAATWPRIEFRALLRNFPTVQLASATSEIFAFTHLLFT